MFVCYFISCPARLLRSITGSLTASLRAGSLWRAAFQLDWPISSPSSSSSSSSFASSCCWWPNSFSRCPLLIISGQTGRHSINNRLTFCRLHKHGQTHVSGSCVLDYFMLYYYINAVIYYYITNVVIHWFITVRNTIGFFYYRISNVIIIRELNISQIID